MFEKRRSIASAFYSDRTVITLDYIDQEIAVEFFSLYIQKVIDLYPKEYIIILKHWMACVFHMRVLAKAIAKSQQFEKGGSSWRLR